MGKHYERIVLQEPFHLSYPERFSDGKTSSITPKRRGYCCTALYRATSFPDNWTLVKDLFRPHRILLSSSTTESGGVHLSNAE